MSKDLGLINYIDKLKVIEVEDQKKYFFDPIRKKNIRVLPEEMVRQLCLYYMIHIMKYPVKHIQVERGLTINGVKRRYDIIVFDRETNPFLLVECKSHTVKVTQEVFTQAALYNMKQNAPHLWITNGQINYISKWDKIKKGHQFLDDLPIYP